MSGRAQEHGGLNLSEFSELNIDISKIIDFSVNSNPYGPFTKVKEAVEKVNISRYPDREVLVLRQLLAEANHVSPENILVGNGTAEIIWLAAHALFCGKRVLIFSPAFGEYQRAAAAVGAEVKIVTAAAPSFSFELQDICHHIAEVQPDFVFLCNPNNPTGQTFSLSEIKYIIKNLGKSILILDEAYRTFFLGDPFGRYEEENVLVMRSMTKDFALAGLRLGYVMGSSEIIRKLQYLQPPWSVNNAAQAAGEAAFEEIETLQSTIMQVRVDSARLQKEIDRPGFTVISSPVNYFLVDVNPLNASIIRRRLLEKAIHVRDCSSFGLPGYIRIGSQLPHENEMLLNTLSDMQQQ